MNRAAVEASETCGCYSCLRVFQTKEIRLWSDSTDPADENPGALRSDGRGFKGFTAVCPFCEDTSVLAGSSVATLSESLLREVRSYWSRGRDEA